jgi:3-oxoadipate enol-lactonase
MRAALLAPQRVRALVLIDTQSGPEDADHLPAYKQMQETWLQVGPVDDLAQTIAAIIISEPEINDTWIAKWRQKPKEAFKTPGDCLLDRDDITDRLGEITCPAIVFHGTEDQAISMDQARALCDGLSGCTGVVPIEGAAHASNLTHPDQVNGPLLEFLRSL